MDAPLDSASGASKRRRCGVMVPTEAVIEVCPCICLGAE
jgi:hypothetical protein